MTSRIHLLLSIPVMIVLVCPLVLFANPRLLMCLNVFFKHNISLSLGLKNTLKQIDVSCTHSFFPPITTFCETPFAQLFTPHSLLIEFAFNDFIEVSIQHLVHHVSRFHFVGFESNEGNCRCVLIHSSLWCNKISWIRCRHWSSRRWSCHWHPSIPNQWNPSSIVQSHRSTDCPRSSLYPIHHCPQPRWTRGMCSSQWESITHRV